MEYHEKPETFMNLCYEEICENYWYAMYGGIRIIVMKNSGHVNISKLYNDRNEICGNFKSLDGWQPHLMKLMDMAVDLELKIHKFAEDTFDDDTNDIIDGLYIHPIFIFHYASWLFSNE